MKIILLKRFKQKVILLFISTLMSMNVFAQTAGYVWKNAPIGGGGFVTGIITHKTSGDRYCRTDVGGAYRWDEANNKWVQLMDWLNESENGFIGVEALALDPQNANNVYMLCGTSYINNGRTAILKSTDKGNTFTYTDVTTKFKAHGNGGGRGNGERLAVDPNNSNILFCGTRANGLWKSTDAGVTWNLAWNGVTTTPNENGICFVVFDPSGSVVNGASQTIYIGVSRTGGGNIYKSTNGGDTFTDITPTTAFMPHRAALQGTTMYVTYADGAGPALNGDGKLNKLNTATGVWTNVTPVHSKDYSYGGVSIDPTNVNRVIVSTCGMYWNNQFGTGWGDFIFLSTDGGSSWTLKNGPNATYDANGMGWSGGGAVNWMDCIEFDQSNLSKVRVIGGGGVYTCSDITAANPSWKYDVIGIEETALLDVTSIPGGPVISSFGDISGFVHEPLTSYPSKKLSPTGGYNNHGIAYAAANPGKVVRIGNEGNIVYYSTDMGASWTAAATNKGAAGRVAVSADGATILHCPWGSTTTWYTTNDGGSWSGCSGVSLGDAIPVADQVNANYFYIYNPTNGQMLRSTNKGVSFSVAGTPGWTTAFHPWVPTLIRTVPGFEGHVWVPLGGNGLKYSTNAGAAYTTVANVSYCKTVGIGKAMPGAGYPTVFIWGTVSGVTGLFRSTDQGATWLRINDDAHQFAGAPLLVGDMNIAGRVYMSAGGGRGLIYWEPDCTPTAITPYVQVDGGTWQQTADATVAAGGSVLFGPQPAQGGSWSWSGPNNFSATSREAAISNIQVNQAGSYMAIYTDSSGCQSTQTFNVIVTSPDTGSTQDPNFHIYLAFGQSNMEGAGAIENQDRVGIDERFKVIGALDCTGGRTHQLGKWTTATPPLVRCWTGLGISDYFGRTMVEDLPSGIKIGIVPVAIGGCDIALFDKVNYASYVATAPSWMKDVINSYGGNPYGRLVEVAKLAQKKGVIKGIIFHQGETNTNNPEWKNKVADVVKNLKTDLQLGDVPFLAGQLLASSDACCSSHNVEVNKLPSLIPNAYVISSAGLVGADPAHFNSASYREFGKRYAKRMIEVLGLTTTCTPTTITPYVQINGGSWQQTATASVAKGDSVKFAPEPATGGSWSWSGPDNFSATTRVVLISNIQSGQAGNYVATHTNSGGCQSTQTFTITVTSADEDAVSLYPNPSSKGRFTVLLPRNSENAVITVFDNLGRKVFEKIAPGGNSIQIDSHLKAGLYHVRINSKGLSFTKKLVVK